MKKKRALAVLPIFALVLLLMCLPKGLSEKLRGGAIALVAPLWEMLQPTSSSLPSNEAQLTLEILQLKNALASTQKLLKEAQYTNLSLQRSIGNVPRHLAQGKHFKDLKTIGQHQLDTVPADVIFRAPSSWNSSLWINVGKATNKTLEKQIVAEKSPVVIGQMLIGMIDYVGERQSRVRLITDSGLVPSVRASRGQPQNRRLQEIIDVLVDNLKPRSDIFASIQEQTSLLQQLEQVQKALGHSLEGLYLAKGELHGSSAPLWRSQGAMLQGIGFNYDFADEEGPARDLRFGTPYAEKGKAVQLLKVHDLLVTTGMDGVFPPGLQVAEIAAVQPLQEGDYYYSLKARPAAGSMDDLSQVFVLPPIGYDPQDQPSLYD